MFKYSIIFKSPNKSQIERISSHFEDYSWEGDFHVEEEITNKVVNGNYLIEFKSKKHFDPSDAEGEFGEIDEDFEKNIYNNLIGKGQFFSSLFFDEMGFEELDVNFIDSDNNEWKVDISKYSDLIKK